MQILLKFKQKQSLVKKQGAVYLNQEDVFHPAEDSTHKLKDQIVNWFLHMSNKIALFIITEIFH